MSAAACLLVLFCQLPARPPALTDFQQTLDAFPPGSIVTIPSGSYGPTLIRQPLTLIGDDPAPTFERLQLAGAAGGKLTLVNLRTTADLTGSGFDELRLLDVEIAANRLHVGGLRYLELTHLSFTPVPFGAVVAPGASIVLLDSAIGSMAGARLYQAGSSCFSLAPTEFAKGLQNDLVLTPPARLGKHFTLSWSVPGPVAILVGKTRTQAPLHVPRATSGCWHLAGSLWLKATVASPGAITMQVPPDPLLLGAEIAFQVVSPGRYLSRPVSTVLR